MVSEDYTIFRWAAIFPGSTPLKTKEPKFKIVVAWPPASTPISATEKQQAEEKETEGETLPLVYQGETIGQLIFAPRAPGEPFTPTERHLLENITHQAGIAAHAVRLTADLQRSRERLVTTREEERRRLRRDLHDELGPTLASQALKLDAALEMLGNDQTQVGALLVDLKTQTQGIVADIGCKSWFQFSASSKYCQNPPRENKTCVAQIDTKTTCFDFFDIRFVWCYSFARQSHSKFHTRHEPGLPGKNPGICPSRQQDAPRRFTLFERFTWWWNESRQDSV